MSNPLIRDCKNYVVLEPCQKEQFLSYKETLKWLEDWLKKMESLPLDLQDQSSNKAAAQRLLDTSCNLEITPGFTLQWFAVRLNPAGYEE